MKNYSIERIAEAADGAIPAKPAKHAQHSYMRTHREMLIVGCCYEMAYLKPSYPELAEVVGVTHTTCMTHLERWREMPWQDRYGWLRLVEGRLARETNTVDAALL